ncbi:MAG: hypothetical protein EBV06_02025 [Planctomycetia bacterium]|nr:hypothetical protein [Planctomycetia bacterium]
MSVLLLLILANGPTASFTFEDGFVIARVTKDGRPAGVCQIKVYNGTSSPPLVEGETEGGVGTFPLGGKAGLVGITIDGKECDLIPLQVTGKEISPSRVLLTFGSRPCCIVAKKEKETPIPTDQTNEYLTYGILAGSVMLIVSISMAMMRGGNAKRIKSTD